MTDTTTTELGTAPRRTGGDRRLSAAPMMDWSDRHCRHFFRLLAPRALLYTEMIVADAVLRGDRARLLDFDASEHPVALQLGGADPATLASVKSVNADYSLVRKSDRDPIFSSKEKTIDEKHETFTVSLFCSGFGKKQ